MSQNSVQRPHRVRVDLEFPSMDHYLAVQRELNAGNIPLGRFAAVATLTLFNQMVADYKQSLVAASEDVTPEVAAPEETEAPATETEEASDETNAGLISTDAD